MGTNLAPLSVVILLLLAVPASASADLGEEAYSCVLGGSTTEMEPYPALTELPFVESGAFEFAGSADCVVAQGPGTGQQWSASAGGTGTYQLEPACSEGAMFFSLILRAKAGETGPTLDVFFGGHVAAGSGPFVLTGRVGEPPPPGDPETRPRVVGAAPSQVLFEPVSPPALGCLTARAEGFSFAGGLVAARAD